MTKKNISTTIILSSIFLITFAYFSIPTEADPGSGRLFGTDGGSGNLLQINPNSGASIIIGNMAVGSSIPSLATDPITGIMYVGTGSGIPNLYTVNPNNAATVFVGNTGLGFAAVGAMDFDSSGTLYAAVNIAGDGGTGSDHLATLNTATGQASIIGPFGNCIGVPPLPVNGAGSCDLEGIEAIAFDPAGNLWGAKTTRGAAGPPGFYSINTGTGAAVFVAPILDGNGFPPSGGITSLQFSCDGTLYGGTARGFGAPDGGFLVTINPADGQFSFVGPTSATNGGSLAALSFETPCLLETEKFYTQTDTDLENEFIGTILPFKDAQVNGNSETQVVKAVVDKKGNIKSYNPGQYYAVTKVTANQNLDEVLILEDDSECTDGDKPISQMNPTKVPGGAYVALMCDGVTVDLSTELANSDPPKLFINENGQVEAHVEDVPEDCMLYLGVKYSPGLKFENVEDVDQFWCENVGSVIAFSEAGIVFTESSTRVLEVILPEN